MGRLRLWFELGEWGVWGGLGRRFGPARGVVDESFLEFLAFTAGREG